MLSSLTQDDTSTLLSIAEEAIHHSVNVSRDVAETLIKHISVSILSFMQHGQQGFHAKYQCDGVTVGFVIVNKFQDFNHLFVLPSFHGQGIGKVLTTEALQVCREKAPQKRVVLNSSENAHGFYRQMGFEDNGEPRNLPGGCIPMTYRFSD